MFFYFPYYYTRFRSSLQDFLKILRRKSFWFVLTNLIEDLLSVDSRRHAEVGLEDTDKISHVLEAAHQRDVQNAVFAILQQGLGAIQAVAVDVFHGGLPRVFFEELDHVGFAVMGEVGKAL